MKKEKKKPLKGLFLNCWPKWQPQLVDKLRGSPEKAFDRWSEGTDDLWQRGKTHSAQCHTKGQTSTWSFCSVPERRPHCVWMEKTSKNTVWGTEISSGKTLQKCADLEPFSVFLWVGAFTSTVSSSLLYIPTNIHSPQSKPLTFLCVLLVLCN